MTRPGRGGQHGASIIVLLRRLVLCALTFLLASSSATAGEMEDARTALEQGDYQTARKLFQPRAERGDAEAAAALGQILNDGGDGIDQNFPEAERWWRIAAVQGNARGQAGLGYLYSVGIVVPRDDSLSLYWYMKAAAQGDRDAECDVGEARFRQSPLEARRWFEKAATQGSSDASTRLGEMYRSGRGLSRNYVEALKWFRKSASQNDLDAQSALGDMYQAGEGVPANFIQAAKWYSVFLQAQGAIGDYGNVFDRFNRLKARMTAEQVATAQQLAIAWRLTYLESYADQGKWWAQRTMARRFKEGLGVPKDLVRSYMWLTILGSARPQSTRNDTGYDLDRIAAKMTPLEIAKGKQLAAEWRPNANAVATAVWP